MRRSRVSRRGRPTTCLFLIASVCSAQTILDRTHDSQVFHETRHYRIFLPRAYESTTNRYPVIYWFHGYGERYNQGPADNDIFTFVSTHDVIVVKWDGSNPPSSRPYNIGPVETDRQFPLYFPELAACIDANFRTIADREHRATAGFSMGGFMSYWIAGKYPDLVSSASSFMGSPEFVVGPRDFPVEYRHEEMADNYAGVRTRLITGTADFIQFYHRQLNLAWLRPTHETENFESEHGTPGMAKTLEFHMQAFANPLPRPDLWNHADVYPNFTVWGWTVETDRTRAGFTQIKSASPTGFYSSVQEWLPGGRVLRNVNVKIATVPLYRKKSPVQVTTVRLSDNQILRKDVLADDEGRLHLNLDGDEYQVRIGAGLAKRSVETFKFPPAPVTSDFLIADHRNVLLFQRATQPQSITLGQGNGDGQANPGETIAILFPDGKAFRAAELFTDNGCVDLTTRISDNWGEYDHVGASAKYTLMKIAPTCGQGRTIKLHARVLVPNKPNHQLHEFTIELQLPRYK